MTEITSEYTVANIIYIMVIQFGRYFMNEENLSKLRNIISW